MYGAYLEEEDPISDYADDYDYDMLDDYDDMLEQDAYLTQKKKKDDDSIDSEDLMDLIEMLEDSDDRLTNKKAYLKKQNEEKDSEDDAQDMLEDYDAYLQEHPDDVETRDYTDAPLASVQGTWDYTYEPKTYETVAPVAGKDMHPYTKNMAYLKKGDR